MSFSSGLFRVGLSWLFSLACLADDGPSRESAEAFLNRLREAAKEYEAPEEVKSAVGKGNVPGSIVLIGSNESRGSGFLCRLWGVPVIVTNAHVWAEQYDSTIENGHGHVYEARAALVAKEQDLALIEVDFPESSNFFELAPHFDELRIDAKATVYGDSEGQRVITELPGQVLSIEPKEIEVSCEFVPGNSGGPVLDADFHVIGVVTYMTRSVLKPKAGEHSGEETRIRRYAIRIDELDIDDFELFDPVEQKKDLDLYRRIAAVNQDIRKDLLLSLLQFETSFYSQFSRLELDWNGKSSISYLNRLIRDGYRNIAVFSAILGIPPIRLGSGERKQAETMFDALKRYRQEKFYCPRCNGKGKFVKDHFTGKKRSPQYQVCPECSGIGKSDAPFYRGILHSPLQSLVKNSPVRFDGIALGMEQRLFFQKLGIREERTDGKNFSGILDRGSIEGQRILPGTREIHFYFTGRQLSRLILIFENGPDTWEELVRQLSERFGDPVITLGDGEIYDYQLFRQSDASLILSRFQLKNPAESPLISLTALHHVLTELEFKILRSLGKGVLIFFRGKE